MIKEQAKNTVNMIDTRNIIIETIQSALVGHLDSSSNFNPASLANAIETKISFNESFEEKNVKQVKEFIIHINETINDIDNDMNNELEQLGPDETVLKNFIMGQKTACEKIRESLNNIKK